MSDVNEEKAKQAEWMNAWRERLKALLEKGKDDFVTELNAAAEAGVPHRFLDGFAHVDRDLECEAIDGSPFPYLLNAGCGFFPTSAGFRTRAGRAVTVVGVDPLAHAINEAHTVMSAAHDSTSVSGSGCADGNGVA